MLGSLTIERILSKPPLLLKLKKLNGLTKVESISNDQINFYFNKLGDFDLNILSLYSI